MAVLGKAGLLFCVVASGVAGSEVKQRNGAARALRQRRQELIEELMETDRILRDRDLSDGTDQWGGNCRDYGCHGYKKWQSCQCTNSCEKYGNCCHDFLSVCRHQGAPDAVHGKQIETTAVLPTFIGMGYNPDAHKSKANPPCDDFMSAWSEPLWGPSTRNDLKVIKDMGAEAVRTYGIGSHIDHTKFLDHAHELGLKVMPGFADYPYLRLGSSCNSQKETSWMKTDCIRGNGHNCYDVIKANYKEMLKRGYTVKNETDGKLYYHPAILTITVINECELKLQYNAAEGLGQNANHAKVVVTATDGILDAEKELDIQGPKPMLTATASYALCPNCKSVHARFPGLSSRTPAMAFMADYYLAFKDPKGYVGYRPKNDLMGMYTSRWVNSFNTPRPADALCVNENRVLKSYTASPLGKVPIYIGEFHSSTLSAPRWGKDIEKVKNIINDKDGGACGKDGNPLKGANLFEYQVSYWKGAGSEGGTGMKYGFWGLGWKKIGHTHPDKHSIGYSKFDVYCLCPAYTGGRCASRSADTKSAQIIKALGGKWPEDKVLC